MSYQDPRQTRPARKADARRIIAVTADPPHLVLLPPVEPISAIPPEPVRLEPHAERALAATAD